MEWKIIGTTFLLMFIAELGDKTQLLVFARSSETRAPVSVFIGAGAALLLSTAIGVLIGGAVGKLPDWVVKGVAGSVFIAMGVWTIWGIWSGGNNVHS